MFQLKEKMLPLATVDCCLRKWKKIVPTSQIISCPLAKLSSFFEKLFVPNSYNKNNSAQKTPFPIDRKSVSTSWMKDLLKNTFPVSEKAAPTLNNL